MFNVQKPVVQIMSIIPCSLVRCFTERCLYVPYAVDMCSAAIRFIRLKNISVITTLAALTWLHSLFWRDCAACAHVVSHTARGHPQSLQETDSQRLQDDSVSCDGSTNLRAFIVGFRMAKHNKICHHALSPTPLRFCPVDISRFT
jgi:hypothetical protein